MSATAPERKFFPVPLGGVWDEASSPRRVGPGLTSWQNGVYRRLGSWGKRPGSKQVYGIASPGPTSDTAVSGIRWYRGNPSAFTALVVAAQGALWEGADPNLGSPTPLHQIASFPGQSPQPAAFCSAYDPSADNATGSDVLIICGFTGPYGFATGEFTLSGTLTPGGTIKITLDGTDITPTYTILPTDNLAIVASNLVDIINNSPFVVPGEGQVPNWSQALLLPAPFGGTSASFMVAALNGGTGGNALTYGGTLSGAGITLTAGTLTATNSGATGAENLTGGGATTSAPLKWDGSTLMGLSPYITNPFTGCVSWHSHVWFWGDPSFPDTMFASDINQPEGWAFMTQNGGGGTSGGYNIGQGDGEPTIRAAVPIGNLMYVFKAGDIYAVSGYDFQSGEYQFQVAPAIQGIGTPFKECVTVLNNALVFWDGSRFRRLPVGAFETEEIAVTIPFTMGKVANGNQSLMRCAAGSFPIAIAPLDGVYQPPVPRPGSDMWPNLVLFACDTGNGVADTVLVYDDSASAVIGNYAWAPWTGWTVGAFVAFGHGQNAEGTLQVEPSVLLWIPPIGSAQFPVNQFGALGASDSGAPIPWAATTGWIDIESTSFLTKDIHRVFLEIEATPGVTMQIVVSKASNIPVQPFMPGQPSITQRAATFPATTGTRGVEAFQILIAQLQPTLEKGYAFMVNLSNAGLNNEVFEVTGALMEYIENPFRP